MSQRKKAELRDKNNNRKAPQYIIEKLAKAGKKLKKSNQESNEKEKIKEVKLLSGNHEISTILTDLLNNYFSDVSGRHLINHTAFKYLTDLFEHQEERLNYLKYRAVVEHLNEITRAEEERKKKKSKKK